MHLVYPKRHPTLGQHMQMHAVHDRLQFMHDYTHQLGLTRIDECFPCLNKGAIVPILRHSLGYARLRLCGAGQRCRASHRGRGHAYCALIRCWLAGEYKQSQCQPHCPCDCSTPRRRRTSESIPRRPALPPAWSKIYPDKHDLNGGIVGVQSATIPCRIKVYSCIASTRLLP